MRTFWVPVWLLAVSGPAAASPVWLAGGEVADQSAYAYAGAVAPLGAGSRLGDGWFQRYWVDWLRYTYDGAGGEVTARAPGGEVAAGYQWPLREGGLEVSAGAVYRKTGLHPAAAESPVEGPRWGAKLQGAAWTRRGPWRFRTIANYILGTKAYWGRVRTYRGTGASFWPGVEAVALGDPEYDAVQLGALLGRIPLGSARHLTLKAGVRLDREGGQAAYAGAELVWGGGPAPGSRRP